MSLRDALKDMIYEAENDNIRTDELQDLIDEYEDADEIDVLFSRMEEMQEVVDDLCSRLKLAESLLESED